MGEIRILIDEICTLLKKQLLNNGYEFGFYLDGRTYKPNMAKGFTQNVIIGEAPEFLLSRLK